MRISSVAAVTVFVVVTQFTSAYSSESAAGARPGGMATLYAHDAGTQKFCFRDGLAGNVVAQKKIENRRSDTECVNGNGTRRWRDYRTSAGRSGVRFGGCLGD